jgi:hypothetical protein
MLVLMKGGIYNVRRWDEILTQFREDCCRRSKNIKLSTQQFEWL